MGAIFVLSRYRGVKLVNGCGAFPRFYVVKVDPMAIPYSGKIAERRATLTGHPRRGTSVEIIILAGLPGAEGQQNKTKQAKKEDVSEVNRSNPNTVKCKPPFSPIKTGRRELRGWNNPATMIKILPPPFVGCTIRAWCAELSSAPAHRVTEMRHNRLNEFSIGCI